ncbi:hypothetical protein [Levilactobacillus acidifarinae]|uniref:Uncharacterized protein n=1 Tax=Levilactobacillus acidifarinae DSM 19394 = JCM 15949 TaxID=1423715 RepID=A0A0R1LNN6_9LACO|nr:hypothetical protein [Levilactobacillus acidifarinae]KRK95203.1 hypothetical protein FD25_GL001586 [Levilactobacillus acidifarinae DSM 19394]GEO70318.1 hypothetical protein LAC03_22280 [Levilactobacillus acidifarinae]
MNLTEKLAWGLAVSVGTALFFGFGVKGTWFVRLLWTGFVLLVNGSAAGIIARYWDWLSDTRRTHQSDTDRLDEFFFTYVLFIIPDILFFGVASSWFTAFLWRVLWDGTMLLCGVALLLDMEFIYYRVVRHQPPRQ